MLRFRKILLTAVAVGLSCAGYAQQGQAAESTSSAGSTAAMPQVVEPPAEQGQAGMLSGDKPFSLMVDENVGELIYTFDEARELESIQAKRGVIFASEDMALNSDEFEYKALNSELVATGQKVVVRMGEMIVTCQIFKYNPEKQEGEFLGNPIVYQRDKEGQVTNTSGKKISVFNANGKFQVRVVGGGGTPTYMKNSGKPGASVPAVGPNAGLENKTLAPGQKPARVTLNTQGSSMVPVAGAARPSGRSSIIPVPSMGSSSN